MPYIYWLLDAIEMLDGSSGHNDESASPSQFLATNKLLKSGNLHQDWCSEDFAGRTVQGLQCM